MTESQFKLNSTNNPRKPTPADVKKRKWIESIQSAYRNGETTRFEYVAAMGKTSLPATKL